MTLTQFEKLKAWHQRHWREQPVEKHAWDMVLTFWLAGWAEVLCLALLFLPGAYVALRRLLHRAGIVRCDWTVALDR